MEKITTQRDVIRVARIEHLQSNQIGTSVDASLLDHLLYCFTQVNSFPIPNAFLTIGWELARNRNNHQSKLIHCHPIHSARNNKKFRQNQLNIWIIHHFWFHPLYYSVPFNPPPPPSTLNSDGNFKELFIQSASASTSSAFPFAHPNRWSVCSIWPGFRTGHFGWIMNHFGCHFTIDFNCLFIVPNI